jgi:hypothetical protein
MFSVQSMPRLCNIQEFKPGSEWLHDSHSCEKVKYGHRPCGTQNQECLLVKASSNLPQAGSQKLESVVTFPVLHCIVRCHYQGTTSEFIEDLVFAVVVCRVWINDSIIIMICIYKL